MAMEDALFVMSYNNPFRSHPLPLLRSTAAATTRVPEPPRRSQAPAASWFAGWTAPSVPSPPPRSRARSAAAAAIVIHDDPRDRAAVAERGEGSPALAGAQRAPAASQRDGSGATPGEGSVDGMDLHEMSLDELPPYPDPERPRQTKTVTASVPRKALLEEFPTPRTRAAFAAPAAGPSSPKCDEATFPGFALFQMARAHHHLGRHSAALDKTTECLTLQRKCFGGCGSSSATAAGGAVGHEATDANGATLTALELRSSFVTGVGSSVLGMLTGSATTGRDRHRGNGHPQPSLRTNPVLSNSSTTLVSQYPSHPCVARTLLLRGHLLARCDRNEDGGDPALCFQAMQHAEMGVDAIRRRPGPTDDAALAPALLLLGDLRSRAGRHAAADEAYREALRLLRDARAGLRAGLAAGDGGDAAATAARARRLARGTRDLAAAWARQGDSCRRQGQHARASRCYREASRLLARRDGGAARRDGDARRSVARRINSRRAVERQVAGHWDDPGAI